MAKKKKKVAKVSNVRATRGVSVSPGYPSGAEPKIEMVAATNERLLGAYCNSAIIHHTKFEFIFDFIWALDDYRVLASRVLTSPQHAKLIFNALGNNISKYEKLHGEIDMSGSKK